MRNKFKLPELLAPAGDMECLYAAVAAGADAIYVGGKRFGARAFAKNFDIDELASAVNYCHLHSVKLYVTLNTLIEDVELASAVEYAAELYRIGVDALIVADFGVAAAIRRYLPDLELHGSTQMSVHNTDGIIAASRLGISRVVLARELPLTDIRSCVDNSPLEIEVFLHGALCVCYSGQCLFSSLVGGRSGNRGECAQPCRLPYNGGSYPLSLKDLSLADHIPALIESGVSSLKIEGRMKAPSYVYAVTSVYRRLLDEGRAANNEERELLRRAFSRGGFTDGYFVGKTEKNMTGVRSKEDKEDSRSLESAAYSPIKHPVRAEVVMQLDKPSMMRIYDTDRSVSVTGSAPVPAQNAPLTEQSVKERLCKMGNTNLSLSADDITLNLDEGVNLPPSAINALRRDAAAAFESSKRTLDEVKYSLPSPIRGGDGLISAQFMSAEEFNAVREQSPSLTDLIDITFLPLMGCSEYTANGVYLPPIIFDSQMPAVRVALENAKKQGVMYALVGNIGQIQLVLDLGLTPIGDFRLNITNRESSLWLGSMGVRRAVLSPELTLPKARDAGGGLITYGRIPLMITERCFIGENFGCKSCGKSSLTDRKGEKFPMLREFDHRNLILNSVPTYMGDREGELREYRIQHRHMIFTTESARQIAEVLSAAKRCQPLRTDRVRRVGRR